MPKDAWVVPCLRIGISCHEGLHSIEEASSTSAAAAAEDLDSGTTTAESTRSWSSSCGIFSAAESGFPAEADAAEAGLPAEADAAEEANVHAYSGRGGG